jgi:hypothetical protein
VETGPQSTPAFRGRDSRRDPRSRSRKGTNANASPVPWPARRHTAAFVPNQQSRLPGSRLWRLLEVARSSSPARAAGWATKQQPRGWCVKPTLRSDLGRWSRLRLGPLVSGAGCREVGNISNKRAAAPTPVAVSREPRPCAPSGAVDAHAHSLEDQRRTAGRAANSHMGDRRPGGTTTCTTVSGSNTTRRR